MIFRCIYSCQVIVGNQGVLALHSERYIVPVSLFMRRYDGNKGGFKNEI